MTKVTENQVLVEDPIDHIKRCPGCWRPLGSAHLDECVTLRRTQQAASEGMSEFLEEALKVQRAHQAARKPKRIVSPASNGATPSRVGGGIIGKVGDFVDSVYHAVREHFPTTKLQIVIETPERDAGTHMRDIPGKHIPIDGTITCALLTTRGKETVGRVTLEIARRTLVGVHFEERA